MRTITTILLALLAALVLLFAVGDSQGWWAGLWGAKPPPELPVIAPEKIDRLAIKSAAGATVIRRDASGLWMVEQPLADRADPERVGNLLKALGQWRRQAHLSAKEMAKSGKNLDAFGLSPAHAIELQAFAGDSLLAKIHVGQAASFEDSCFAILGEQTANQPILTVTSNLRPWLDVPADAFLDPMLVRFGAENVLHLEWQKEGAVGFALERKDAQWPWRLIRPMQAQADGERAQALMESLAKMRVAEIVSTEQSQAILKGPLKDVQTLTLGRGEGQASFSVRLIPAPEEGAPHCFAQVSARGLLFKISADALRLTPTEIQDWRDRKLLRLQPADVDKITLTSRGQTPLRVQQTGTEWFFLGADDLPGEMANGERADLLFRKLTGETVTARLPDAEEELAKLGLIDPALTVAFEGEGIGQDGGNLLTLRLANLPGDQAHAYVKMEGEPGVAAVSWTLASSLSGIAQEAYWRRLEVLNIAFESLRVVSLLPANAEPLTLRLNAKDGDPEKKLALAVGEKDASASLDRRRGVELLLTVATLSAKRWLASADEARAMLEKPALIVAVETEIEGTDGQAAKREVTRIKLAPTAAGAVDPEFYFGQVDGQPQVFLLGRVEFLRLSGVGLVLK